MKPHGKPVMKPVLEASFYVRFNIIHAISYYFTVIISFELLFRDFLVQLSMFAVLPL